MATADLTGKLGLGEKPTIKVGDVTLTVDNSASSVLRIMELLGGDVKPDTLVKAIDLLFDAKSRKAIDKMQLSFDDLALLVQTATELVVGGSEGEAATLDTTS